MLTRSRVLARQALCLAATAFAYAVDAQASATPSDLANMSLKELMALEVFTSASLMPTQASKAPATTYSFSHEDFTRLGVRRLDDLLQFVPGIQVSQYRKRHRAIWARGLIDRYNDKMILLLDGVPVRHLYYGHFALGDNFPLEKVERVEIILGPASSLYGANAFGGIISVTTLGGSADATVDATLEVADNDRVKVTGFYGGEHIQAFASYLDQDAPFRESRRSFIGGDVEQPVDENYQNVMIKAQPLDGLSLTVDYSRAEEPFLFIPDTQDAFIESDFLSLAATYRYGNMKDGQFEVIGFYQDDQAREFEREQQTNALGYEENQDAIMAGITTTAFRQFGDHVGALGLSWRHERAENMRFYRAFYFGSGFLSAPETGSLLSNPEIRSDDYAVYLQDVWAVNQHLDLTVGARYDRFDQFGDYFNYRGALVFSPDTQQTIKLLYGTAIRTPGFREYLKVLENTTFVAPVPDAEQIKSLEIGYQYQWDQVNVSVNAYRNNVKDFIREFPTPDNADEYFDNDSRGVRLRGVDFMLNAHATDALTVRVGFSYIDSNLDDSGSIPYLANYTGNLLLDYSVFDRLTVGGGLVWYSNRDDKNSFKDDESDAFAVINLFASGRLTEQLSYRFGIDNVFNEKAYDPAADFGGQYNPERSEREIWLGLQWMSAR